MINLNDSKFNSSDVKVINGGIPGIVNNVTIKVTKKKPEDKENDPEFKLIFTDETGGETNIAFWYAKAVGTATLDEMIISQGKVLKHLIHAVCGNVQIPTFTDEKDMLMKSISLIKKSADTGLKFRIFTTFGTVKKPNQYLQVRSYVPFIESMSVPVENTVLTVRSSDNMVKLTPSTTTGTVSAKPAAPVASANVDDDWN